MSDCQAEKKAPLYAVIDSFNFDAATKKLLATRKVSEDGATVTLEEISHNMGDKTLKLRGTNVAFEDIHKMASSTCKTCMSKGYYVSSMSKQKLKDPSGYMILEEEVPADLSEEQKKIWQAKIESNQCWKIFNNCSCAINRYMRKNDDVVVNGFHNIFVRLDYDFVPLELGTESNAVAPVSVPAIDTSVESTNIYVEAAKTEDPKQE